MEMTQVQRLTKMFQELDRVTPRPLDHEDYAICADQFFRDGQIDHIKDTQAILKSGIESVEAKLQDLANDNKGLKREFINFLTHIQAYPVQLTPGLRAEIENYITKLLK